VRGERLVGAPGPGRAAQAGSGQPDGAAGDVQDGVGDQGRPRERPQPAVEARHDYSHLKVLAVRTVPITAHTRSTPRSPHAVVPSISASRIASPSAPEGSQVATSPQAPYADGGSTTAPPARSSR